MKLRDLAGIVLLALMWSPTFLLVRIGVHEVPPLTMTWMRVLFAGLFLLGLSKLKGRTLRPYLKLWPKLLIAGLLNNVLAFTFCSYGEMYADSSTAGIIEGSVPLYTLLVSVVVLKQWAVERRQLLGAFLGFLGLMLILLPTANYEGEGIGIGLVLLNLMAMSFACGFLYSEKELEHVPPLEAATLQVMAGALLMTPFVWIIDIPHTKPMPSSSVFFVIGVLGLIGTALPWILYFNLVKSIGARLVSFATPMVPVFAMLLGALFLNENMYWYKILGGMITVLSVLLVGPTGDILFSWLDRRQLVYLRVKATDDSSSSDDPPQ